MGFRVCGAADTRCLLSEVVRGPAIQAPSSAECGDQAHRGGIEPEWGVVASADPSAPRVAVSPAPAVSALWSDALPCGDGRPVRGRKQVHHVMRRRTWCPGLGCSASSPFDSSPASSAQNTMFRTLDCRSSNSCLVFRPCLSPGLENRSRKRPCSFSVLCSTD